AAALGSAGGLSGRPARRGRARAAARGGRAGDRDHPLPAGGVIVKDVAVLGVGMQRFGMWPDRSSTDLGREAGLAALRDAGLSFRDVQAAYVGSIFAPVMRGHRRMEALGVTA